MNYDLLLLIKNQLWKGNGLGNQFYEVQSGSSHVSGDDLVVFNRVLLILIIQSSQKFVDIGEFAEFEACRKPKQNLKRTRSDELSSVKLFTF
jgi:hypothetical protein